MTGPLAEGPWLRRVWDRLGGMFDQDREALAQLNALLVEVLAQGVTLDSILAIDQLIAAVAPADLIYSNLVTAGDSSDMAVDFSGADGVFRYTCPADRVAEIHRLNWWGVDNVKIVPNGFFSLAALSVGDGMLVRLIDSDNSLLFDFADGDEILHHGHLALLAGVDVQTDTTANLSEWSVRWTLSLGIGGPLLLTAGQHLEVTLRDDLSGFEEFEAMTQGRLRDV